MRAKLARPAQLYLWLVVASATVLLAGWSLAWPGHLAALAASADAADARQLALAIILVLLGVVATHFPLGVTPRYEVDVSTAVYFATLLLFGPPVAMLLNGASQLLGEASLGLRRLAAGRRMRSARSILFNTAQVMLATGLGGAAYYAWLPHQAPALLDRVENLWAIPIAAAVIYLANTAAVATMTGLQLQQRPLEVWRRAWQRDLLPEAGLLLIGLLAARSGAHDLVLLILLVLPAAIIYLLMKRTVQLIAQTIAAVEALADVVDRRDRYTFEHSRRVAAYAVHVARHLGLPLEELETLRLAARVHDLGKIGVPDRVLHKPGRLTAEEWAIMRRHPQIGHDILAQFPEYRRGKELVLAHHERLDGKGYPRGLQTLDLAAQILAVADAFDAMTSDRPYRRALPLQVALDEIERGKGSQWPARVADTLIQLAAAGSGPFATLHATLPTPNLSSGSIETPAPPEPAHLSGEPRAAPSSRRRYAGRAASASGAPGSESDPSSVLVRVSTRHRRSPKVSAT